VKRSARSRAPRTPARPFECVSIVDGRLDRRFPPRSSSARFEGGWATTPPLQAGPPCRRMSARRGRHAPAWRKTKSAVRQLFSIFRRSVERRFPSTQRPARRAPETRATDPLAFNRLPTRRLIDGQGAFDSRGAVYWFGKGPVQTPTAAGRFRARSNPGGVFPAHRRGRATPAKLAAAPDALTRPLHNQGAWSTGSGSSTLVDDVPPLADRPWSFFSRRRRGLPPAYGFFYTSSSWRRLVAGSLLIERAASIPTGLHGTQLCSEQNPGAGAERPAPPRRKNWGNTLRHHARSACLGRAMIRRAADRFIVGHWGDRPVISAHAAVPHESSHGQVPWFSWIFVLRSWLI